MNLQLFEILVYWLNVSKYRFPIDLIKMSLVTHPNYGTLQSITDVLDELGVQHSAASIPFQHIESLTEPYVAYIKNGHEEQFALVFPLSNNSYKLLLDKGKGVVISKTELEVIWTNTIIAIEKNEAKSKIGLTPDLSIVAFTAVAVILISLFLFKNGMGFQLLYFILTLMGLVFGGLIVNHQLGYTNGLTAKLCTLNKNSSCDNVLNSKAAKLTKHIGLSDIGIVYFTSQLFTQLLVNSTSINSSVHGVSILGIPFVFYSLYQQKFIIKKWCPLCLLLITILFFQGFFSIFQVRYFSIFNLRELLLFGLVVVLVSILWYLLFPSLPKNTAYKTQAIELLSFKRNYHLLLPYLQNQQILKTNFNFITNSLGNANAKLKLTVVTNPLCEGCIEVHTLLYKLLETNNQLSINLVYYVPLNSNDPRTIIAAHFLRLKGLQLKMEMEKWYSNPDPKSYLSQLSTPPKPEDFQPIEKHKFWCHANSIYTTPAILINGRRFPVFYKPTDIQFFIGELTENADSFQPMAYLNSMFVDKT